MNWLMNAHLIGGTDNLERVEQICIEVNEPFGNREVKTSTTSLLGLKVLSSLIDCGS